MKYRQELRRLAFILVPFIALLSLHILIPLQITTNYFNLFTEVHDLASFGLHFRNTARSNHLQNANIFRVFYVRLTDQLFLLRKRQLAEWSKYISGNWDDSQLLDGNAMFRDKTISQSMVNGQNKSSLWVFEQGEGAIGLSAGVKVHTGRYRSIEPYIKSYFQGGSESFAQSISAFYQDSNESIAFEYPPLLQNRITSVDYANLSATYQIVLNQYYRHSNQSLVLPLFDEHTKQISLCLPAITALYQSVICLNFDLSLFAALLTQRMNLLLPEYLTQDVFVAMQTVTAGGQHSKLLLQFNSSGLRAVSLSNSSAFQPDQKMLNPQNSLYTIVNKKGDLYVSQVASQTGNTRSILLGTQVSVATPAQTYGQLYSKLNTIVILTVALVFIETVIISAVLKSLLESVDQDLFELQHMTEMVLGGDINIEIGSYGGTEDIKQVYQQAKIINKLHRYSTQSYFSGHFSEKILKYVQALQFINSLKYDPGNLLENLGQAYTYIEEWDLSLKYLKQSVDNVMAKIEADFGPYSQIFKLKLNKHSFALQYRKMQLVLIRRLFKLNYCYIKYLQLGPTWLKQASADSPDDGLIRKHMERLNAEFADNAALIKTAFYPNFEKFSEILVLLGFQCKNKLGNKKLVQAKEAYEKLEQLFQLYKQNHPSVMKLLKEKGSKNKFLYSCNKLTFQSRFHPDLLVPLMALTKTKLISLLEPSPQKYNQIFHFYGEGFKTGSTTLNTAYMLGLEIRKSMVQLKIDPGLYESTQIFKQVIPFRTLHEEEVNKDNELALLKKAGTQCVGLEREYLFLFDCEKDILNQDHLQEFYDERTAHIFQKLIKGHDRISVMKYNGREGIKIDCNLTMKHSNDALLLKCIQQALKQKNKESRLNSHLFDAVHRTVMRIKGLKQQKVLLVFFRSLKHYAAIAAKVHKRKTYSDKRKTQFDISIDESHGNTLAEYQQFGQYLTDILRTPGLRNTKLILFCGKDSNMEFLRFFGLKDINRRIWAHTAGINKANNLVYVIEDKHRSDIDRILMPKVTDVPDNNIFIL